MGPQQRVRRTSPGDPAARFRAVLAAAVPLLLGLGVAGGWMLRDNTDGSTGPAAPTTGVPTTSSEPTTTTPGRAGDTVAARSAVESTTSAISGYLQPWWAADASPVEIQHQDQLLGGLMTQLLTAPAGQAVAIPNEAVVVSSTAGTSALAACPGGPTPTQASACGPNRAVMTISESAAPVVRVAVRSGVSQVCASLAEERDAAAAQAGAGTIRSVDLSGDGCADAVAGGPVHLVVTDAIRSGAAPDCASLLGDLPADPGCAVLDFSEVPWMAAQMTAAVAAGRTWTVAYRAATTPGVGTPGVGTPGVGTPPGAGTSGAVATTATTAPPGIDVTAVLFTALCPVVAPDQPPANLTVVTPADGCTAGDSAGEGARAFFDRRIGDLAAGGCPTRVFILGDPLVTAEALAALARHGCPPSDATAGKPGLAVHVETRAVNPDLIPQAVSRI